jgi:DNA (cytosine-5)-methyltransferase 1
VDAVPTLKGGSTEGIPSAPAIWLPECDVVMPNIRDAERLQGFPANWTRPAERVARSSMRWKLVGNAVSVPAAAWLGRRFLKPGKVLDFPLASVRGTHWPGAAWNMGDGRVAVDASERPVQRRYTTLLQFLKYSPRMLSTKATRGFLERTERSSLNFPEGFLDALRAHEARMSSRDVERSGRRGTAAAAARAA